MAPRGPKQPWTDADRTWLRELAAVHSSDLTIARIMGRKPNPVGWQRRVMRIKLTGNPREKFSAARPGFYSPPVLVPPKFNVSSEREDRVAKMMALAGRR
jgi:hypothetical protein